MVTVGMFDINEPVKGWYFNDGRRREYFVKSDQVRKTDKFLKSILEACNIGVSERSLSYLKANITPAYYEVRKSANGYKYINIYGSSFSGFGDENTFFITLV